MTSLLSGFNRAHPEDGLTKPNGIRSLGRESEPGMEVSRYAEADLPTVHGPFRVLVYRASEGTGPAAPGAPGEPVQEHMALVRGDVSGASNVLCRVHSECWTSEV